MSASTATMAAERAAARRSRNRPADSPGPLAMWVFIASEILFFGALFVAYAVARVHGPPGFAQASRHTDVVLGTLNTGLLLTSSAVMAAAVACSQTPRRRATVAPLLWLTAALGVAFLAVKGLEYRQDWLHGWLPGAGFAMRDVAGAELFFAFYFVVTALHAVHLSIGIAAVGIFGWGHARRRTWCRGNRIEALGLYWHFVDVVWIFLYPLLYLAQRQP